MAMGDLKTPVRIIDYLRCTQEADGHWPQNFWLNGSPYWEGIQLDEVAFPIILAGDSKIWVSSRGTSTRW